jgi:hypothetical protein
VKAEEPEIDVPTTYPKRRSVRYSLSSTSRQFQWAELRGESKAMIWGLKVANATRKRFVDGLVAREPEDGLWSQRLL